jgi:hypothetical protein
MPQGAARPLIVHGDVLHYRQEDREIERDEGDDRAERDQEPEQYSRIPIPISGTRIPHNRTA